MESIADAVAAISKSTEAIEASQKQLNDNFLLHQEKSEKSHELLAQIASGTKDEVHGIKEDLKATIFPILKWAVVALIVIAGGAEALKLLGVV